jgi:hypothetical protein
LNEREVEVLENGILCCSCWRRKYNYYLLIKDYGLKGDLADAFLSVCGHGLSEKQEKRQHHFDEFN